MERSRGLWRGERGVLHWRETILTWFWCTLNWKIFPSLIHRHATMILQWHLSLTEFRLTLILSHEYCFWIPLWFRTMNPATVVQHIFTFLKPGTVSCYFNCLNKTLSLISEIHLDLFLNKSERRQKSNLNISVTRTKTQRCTLDNVSCWWPKNLVQVPHKVMIIYTDLQWNVKRDENH